MLYPLAYMLNVGREKSDFCEPAPRGFPLIHPSMGVVFPGYLEIYLDTLPLKLGAE